MKMLNGRFKRKSYQSSRAQSHELDPPQEEALSWDSKEYGHGGQWLSRTTVALEALGENVFISAKVDVRQHHRLGRGWEVQDQGAARFGSR